MHVELKLTVGGPSLTALDIRIVGQPLSSGGGAMTSSNVTLGTASTPAVYRGRVTALDGPNVAARVRSRRGSLALVTQLQIDPRSGAVSGAVSARPGSRSWRGNGRSQMMALAIDQLLPRVLAGIARPLPLERGVRGRLTLIRTSRPSPIWPCGWFRQVGTLRDPGSTLVTVSGAVARPEVYERGYPIIDGDVTPELVEHARRPAAACPTLARLLESDAQ